MRSLIEYARAHELHTCRHACFSMREHCMLVYACACACGAGACAALGGTVHTRLCTCTQHSPSNVTSHLDVLDPGLCPMLHVHVLSCAHTCLRLFMNMSRSTDARPLLRSIMSAFFDGHSGFVDMCVRHLPSPLAGTATKVDVNYTGALRCVSCVHGFVVREAKSVDKRSEKGKISRQKK